MKYFDQNTLFVHVVHKNKAVYFR